MPRSSIDAVVVANLNRTLEKRGRSAYSVATALGRAPNWLYQVINGKDGILLPTLREVAAELGVTVGSLVDPPNGTGLTDYPTPSAELRAQVEELSANRSPANDLADNAALVETSFETTRPPGAQPVSVRRLQTAAGSGALDLDEEVKTYAYFREEWLKRRGLVAEKCSIISVMGESMEPTLPDGCVVLLDHNRRSRHKGKIFVVRTEDGLVVKRAGKDPGGRWQLVSDHPAWPPQPWARATVIGEVKWMAREL